MDGNAFTNIHLALADEVLSSVVEKKTVKDIWDTLTKLYESKSLHNKIFLKLRLYTLRMVETTSVSDAIQPSKDPLEVPAGPVTRLRAKKFKEAFNGLLQDTWAKVDFKRICNNKKQALINLIHVQEGLVG
jgi:hypothetical protein